MLLSLREIIFLDYCIVMALDEEMETDIFMVQNFIMIYK